MSGHVQVLSDALRSIVLNNNLLLRFVCEPLNDSACRSTNASAVATTAPEGAEPVCGPLNDSTCRSTGVGAAATAAAVAVEGAEPVCETPEGAAQAPLCDFCRFLMEFVLRLQRSVDADGVQVGSSEAARAGVHDVRLDRNKTIVSSFTAATSAHNKSAMLYWLFVSIALEPGVVAMLNTREEHTRRAPVRNRAALEKLAAGLLACYNDRVTTGSRGGANGPYPQLHLGVGEDAARGVSAAQGAGGLCCEPHRQRDWYLATTAGLCNPTPNSLVYEQAVHEPYDFVAYGVWAVYKEFGHELEWWPGAVDHPDDAWMRAFVDAVAADGAISVAEALSRTFVIAEAAVADFKSKRGDDHDSTNERVVFLPEPSAFAGKQATRSTSDLIDSEVRARNTLVD